MILKRDAFAKNQPSLEAGKLVFIDEAGVDIAMSRSQGWAPPGVTPVIERPARGRRISLIGAIALILALLACGIDLPLRKGETVRLPLADVENGDGQSVAEFVDDELMVTLQVDWSFVNLPGLAPDVIDVT